MTVFQLAFLLLNYNFIVVMLVDAEHLRHYHVGDHHTTLIDKLCPNLRNLTHFLLPKDHSRRGIVMCGADKFLSDVKKMLYQNRYMWCSSLNIVVAHCDEISESNQQKLRSIDPTIRFMNLCSPAAGEKSFPNNAKDRFHGFFCKVGALIASPFEETMFVDVDVVWFKQPDRLFDSQYYKKTGMLLFRDRSFYPVTSSTPDDKSKRYREVTSFFKQHGVSIDLESSKRRAAENEVNLFWLHMWRLLRGDGSQTFPVDFGESSVLLFRKKNHLKTLKVLEELLPSFGVGYGDKEIYWMAATIADEPYSFSPYLTGQFGDCSGPVFHYDPDESEDTVTPFYANAGLIVDEFRFVGDHFHHVMTTPVRASLNDSRSIADYRWFYTPQTSIEDELSKKYSCACQNLDCGRVPEYMYRHLLFMQWLSISMKFDASSADSNCVPVSLQWLDRIDRLFAENITSKGFCHQIGCPFLPLKVNTTLPWDDSRLDYAKNKYCEPVYFAHANISEKEMAERAADARTPFSKWSNDNRHDPSDKKRRPPQMSRRSPPPKNRPQPAPPRPPTKKEESRPSQPPPAPEKTSHNEEKAKEKENDKEKDKGKEQQGSADGKGAGSSAGTGNEKEREKKNTETQGAEKSEEGEKQKTQKKNAETSKGDEAKARSSADTSSRSEQKEKGTTTKEEQNDRKVIKDENTGQQAGGNRKGDEENRDDGKIGMKKSGAADESTSSSSSDRRDGDDGKANGDASTADSNKGDSASRPSPSSAISDSDKQSSSDGGGSREKVDAKEGRTDVQRTGADRAQLRGKVAPKTEKRGHISSATPPSLFGRTQMADAINTNTVGSVPNKDSVTTASRSKTGPISEANNRQSSSTAAPTTADGSPGSGSQKVNSNIERAHEHDSANAGSVGEADRKKATIRAASTGIERAAAVKRDVIKSLQQKGKM